MNKRQVRAGMVALVLALLVAGCAASTPGTVADRKVCKTSTCLYIEHDDGITDWAVIGLASWPHCVKGARWPDCKGE